MTAAEAARAFLITDIGQLYVLIGIFVGIASFFISMLTLWIDIWHFRRSTLEFRNMTEAMSTRFVGNFPVHLAALTQLISEATEDDKIEMLCDGVDYGSFAAPERHKRLLVELENARSRGVPIEILLWGPPQAMSIMNKFRDLSRRDDEQFRSEVNAFVASWNDETGFLGRLDQIYDKLNGKSFNTEIDDHVSLQQLRWMLSQKSFENYTTSKFSAELTALQLCLHEWVYQRLQDKRVTIHPKDPREFSPETIKRLTNIGLQRLIQDEVTIRPGFFFWRVGNKAIYLMPVPGDDALAFKTEDSHLVKAFGRIFDYETKTLNKKKEEVDRALRTHAVKAKPRHHTEFQVRTLQIYLLIFVLMSLTGLLGLVGLGLKICAALASIEFTTLGYLLYLTQMKLNGPLRVKPQPVTWGLFGITTLVAALVQAALGNGLVGIASLIVTSFGCFYITYKTWTEFTWRFNKFHYLTIAVVMLAMIFYAKLLLAPFVAQYAFWAALLASVADLIAYGPSLEKAYKNPLSESPVNAFWNAVKFLPAYFALEARPLPAWLFMAIIGMFNLAYSGGLFYWQYRQRNSFWPFNRPDSP